MVTAVCWSLLAVAPRAHTEPGFSEYCAALRLYTDGRVEAAQAAIEAWSVSGLRRALPLTRSCVGKGRSMGLAVTVITDVAVRVSQTPQRVAEYLSAAESILRSVAPDELIKPTPAAVARFQKDWYVAAGALMIAWTDPARASAFIDRGLHAFKDHAPLHTLAGMAFEMRAHLRDGNLHDPSVVANATLSPLRSQLVLAEGEFRRALALDADAGDARVHLGRVLYLRKALKEARDVLGPVAGGAGPDAWRYLAHLFLGAINEFEHDCAAAGAHYEAAIRIIPDVQTPYIALSFVEQGCGHDERARELMTKWSTTYSTEVDDPWSAYQNGGFNQALFDRLRGQVLR